MVKLFSRSQGIFANLGLSAGKRSCGSCEHYDPSTLDGHGWCRNPSRVGKDHMVLVRSYELACRNAWERDEWVPKGKAHKMAGSQPEEEPVNPAFAASRSAGGRPETHDRTEAGPQPPVPAKEKRAALPSGSHEKRQYSGILRARESTSLAYYMEDTSEMVVGLRDRAEQPAPSPAEVPFRQDPDENEEPPSDLVAEMREEWLHMQRTKYEGKHCKSCRYFESTVSPGLGWCRNRFAIPFQKLVEEGSLACISSIGIWWQERPDDRLRAIRDRMRRP